MPTSKSRERAVVLGASMGGLLAARVLADFYDTVTVVERDVLPSDAANRRGVPQGQHGHAVLPRCSQVLDELFPGFLDELVASGVPVWDDGDLAKVDLSVGGHQFCRTGSLRNRDSYQYYPSRPFLESQLRQRVQAIPNIKLLDGHDIAGLTSNRDRVTGARVVNRNGGGESSLPADLVVDATGRGSRTPAFLETLGYGRPREDELVVHLAYASQLLRIPPGTLDVGIFAVFPEPGRPTTFAFVGYEDDTWMLTLGGMLGQQPPTERAEMLEFGKHLAPASALAALRDAEPLEEPAQYRVPSNRWRRYDKMHRMPDGLIVFGDAICSFNPIYGQGMTVASIEAIVLRDCMRRGDRDLPRRFFRASAKKIRVAWQMAVGSDLALPEVVGPHPLSMRMTNSYVDRVLAAAETDPVVAEQFLRVSGMIDPPTRLARPSFIFRVARTHLRRRTNGSRRHDSADTLTAPAESTGIIGLVRAVLRTVG
jgi:2-polyprenyl-6-methoxyphenol hydroxylase-like FAD-dependent oxidoreductase